MERMYEVPESRGKEPPETQAMIDRMKEAEACEVSAMVERLAMGRLRERAQAARDTRERMEYELLSRIIETRSALDQIGEIVDEAGDTWCYVVALKTYAAECGGHGLPCILLDRARAGLDRFIVYRKRVNETLVLSENEKKVCTENIVKAVLSGI